MRSWGPDGSRVLGQGRSDVLTSREMLQQWTWGLSHPPFGGLGGGHVVGARGQLQRRNGSAWRLAHAHMGAAVGWQQ